jgi:hypothetical protein
MASCDILVRGKSLSFVSSVRFVNSTQRSIGVESDSQPPSLGWVWRAYSGCVSQARQKCHRTDWYHRICQSVQQCASDQRYGQGAAQMMSSVVNSPQEAYFQSIVASSISAWYQVFRYEHVWSLILYDSTELRADLARFLIR